MTVAIEEPNVATGFACRLCGNPLGGGGAVPHLRGLVDPLTDESFDIDRCTECGLLATRPLPAPDQIGRYYPARYRGNRHGFTGGLRNRLRRRQVEKLFPAGFRGRLLDVGCGNGDFARTMHAAGWDVAATEIDPPTVARLHDQGIDARIWDDVAATGFDQPFDAVTCWHVMEHVDHPRETADWVRSQLKPDGHFQVTVPNVAALQAKFFGRNWVHLDVPRHRQHFTPGTLRSLLESTGFAIERRTNVAWEYDWFGVIQSAINAVYPKKNVLFDKLTNSPNSPSTKWDAVFSFAAGYVIAAASALPLLATAACGDGATLTLTCRPAERAG
jgi:2-polyprenyl-3-methyl-5-hydroxy-6-metoxy-1,4-benzoquinol methylase